MESYDRLAIKSFHMLGNVWKHAVEVVEMVEMELYNGGL